MLEEASDNAVEETNVVIDNGQCGSGFHGHRRTRRIRCAYAVAIGVVLLLGLAIRSSWAEGLPWLITAYGGDTLWSLALFLALGFVFPRLRTGHVALLTIGVSFGIELSQLHQAPWINAIRDTRIGGLILGFGFKWSDLLCYTVGCLLGVAVEVLMRAVGSKRAR